MAMQHRRYRLKPGVFDEFVDLFLTQVVPARERYGFRVVGAWASRDDGVFTWVVAHDGDFATADREYYDSPERAAISPNPSDLLEDVETTMVEPVTR